MTWTSRRYTARDLPPGIAYAVPHSSRGSVSAICGQFARNPDHAPAPLRHRPRRSAGVATLIAVPLAAGRAGRRRPSPRPAPDSFADLAAKLLPAVVNVSSTQTVHGAQRRPRRRAGNPDVPARLAVRAVLQGLPQPQPPGRPGRRRDGDSRPARAGAAHAEPRLGLHHRSVRPDRDQQPRDRRRRRDHRDAAGQHHAEGQGGRPRRDRRHRAAAR